MNKIDQLLRQIEQEDLDPSLYWALIAEAARLGTAEIFFKVIRYIVPTLDLKQLPGILFRVSGTVSSSNYYNYRTLAEIRDLMGPRPITWDDQVYEDYEEIYGNLFDERQAYRLVKSPKIYYLSPELRVHDVSDITILRLAGYNNTELEDNREESYEERVRFIQENLTENHLLGESSPAKFVESCCGSAGIDYLRQYLGSKRYKEYILYQNQVHYRDFVGFGEILLPLLLQDSLKYMEIIVRRINRGLQENVVDTSTGKYYTYIKDKKTKRRKRIPLIQYLQPTSLLTAQGHYNSRNLYNHVIEGKISMFLARTIGYDLLTFEKGEYYSTIPIEGLRVLPHREWLYYQQEPIEYDDGMSLVAAHEPANWPLNFPVSEAQLELIANTRQRDIVNPIDLAQARRKILRDINNNLIEISEYLDIDLGPFISISAEVIHGDWSQADQISIVAANGPMQIISIPYADAVGVIDLNKYIVLAADQIDFSDPKLWEAI